MELTIEVKTKNAPLSPEIPLIIGVGKLVIGNESNDELEIIDAGASIDTFDDIIDGGDSDFTGDILDLQGAVVGSSSLTVTLDDFSSVALMIARPGFHPYEITIDNVYNEDRTLYITMVPIVTDITSPTYNQPFPGFYAFISPCGFDMSYYTSSSFNGNITWYINNQEFSTGKKGFVEFGGPGEYQLKQRNETFGVQDSAITKMWDNQYATAYTGNTVPFEILPIETYLNLDITTNVEIKEHRPDFSIALNTITNQLESKNCYTRGEEITIVPTVSINKENDLPENYLIEYEVIGPIGIPIPLSVDNVTVDENDLQTSFEINELGTYQLSATITDTVCGNSYKRELEINTCNFVDIDYVDCNNYLINNRSSDKELLVNVYSIEDEVIVEDQTIEVGESLEINFANISLYKVEITYTDAGGTKTEIYVLNNYCVLDDCVSKYILDILCNDADRCEPCADDVELNQMLLLSNTYFMKLHKEYGWNNFYTGLSDTKLEELTSIKQTMDKLKEFCERRGCLRINSTLYTSVKPSGDCNCN